MFVDTDDPRNEAYRKRFGVGRSYNGLVALNSKAEYLRRLSVTEFNVDELKNTRTAPTKIGSLRAEHRKKKTAATASALGLALPYGPDILITALTTPGHLPKEQRLEVLSKLVTQLDSSDPRATRYRLLHIKEIDKSTRAVEIGRFVGWWLANYVREGDTVTSVKTRLGAVFSDSVSRTLARDVVSDEIVRAAKINRQNKRMPYTGVAHLRATAEMSRAVVPPDYDQFVARVAQWSYSSWSRTADSEEIFQEIVASLRRRGGAADAEFCIRIFDDGDVKSKLFVTLDAQLADPKDVRLLLYALRCATSEANRLGVAKSIVYRSDAVKPVVKGPQSLARLMKLTQSRELRSMLEKAWRVVHP